MNDIRIVTARLTAASLIMLGTAQGFAQNEDRPAEVPQEPEQSFPMTQESTAGRIPAPAPRVPASGPEPRRVPGDELTRVPMAPPQMYVPFWLPAVYAPGPGYGPFTRGGHSMHCY